VAPWRGVAIRPRDFVIKTRI